MPAVSCRVGRIGSRLDDEDLRVPGTLEVHGVSMQFAESATKGLMLFAVQCLVPEHQDHPVQKSLVNTGHGLIIERLGQIHTGNFSTDMWCQRFDFHRLIVTQTA